MILLIENICRSKASREIALRSVCRWQVRVEAAAAQWNGVAC